MDIEEKFDITLCVLACAKSEKHIQRLKDFVEIFGFKLSNPEIKARVVFLVDDEPRPEFLDPFFVWRNVPSTILSSRFVKYMINEEEFNSNWVMQVDDDSSTDLDKTVELLRQFYDHDDCVVLMGGRNTDLEPNQQAILRRMDIKNFFFESNDINSFEGTPYFFHAWEPSIFSVPAIEKMKKWDRINEYLDLCSKYEPVYGDQTPYVIAKLSKVPVSECLFLSSLPKDDEYSAINHNGRFSHIHYITPDKWGGFEEFKIKMAEIKKGVFTQTKEKEADNLWEFWANDSGGLGESERYIGLLKFNSDGSIGIYQNPNESFWEAEDDNINLLDSDRNKTSVLSKISDEEYSGNFMLSSNIVHKIRKVKFP
jgi:hypothetical protein